MMVVSVDHAGGELRIGQPKVLFEANDGRFAGLGGDAWYDVSPDGKRFLMISAAESRNSDAMVVIQDWSTELKTRVPVPH